MTRDEAITLCTKASAGKMLKLDQNHTAMLVVDSLSALGLLKLDEPKSVEDEAAEVLSSVWVSNAHYFNVRNSAEIIGPQRSDEIIRALRQRGFKITRAG